MNNFVVLVNEEYGFRHWIWDTHMSKEALIEWWTNLATVEPYFFDPAKLPGNVRQVEEEDFYQILEGNQETPHLHLHMDDDSWFRLDGAILNHAGCDNTNFVTS